MKPYDLLSYMELADAQYVEEASDRSLLLYRKRVRRTRFTAAACLALVVLAGALFAKPALYAWETRNTVTSWPTSIIRFPGATVKPSTPIYVSAEMPSQKKFSADTPFTLSVGLGQSSNYEYATLSITAQHFEITDKDGNTVIDRYVRTLSDFNSGDYGMQYGDGKNKGHITGCEFLENFTFRYVGSDKATGWGVIEFSLQSRDESSSMGDTVAVYYTLQNGVLKLTDKKPVRDGSQNGGVALEVETQTGEITLSKEDISIRVDMPSGALTPGQYLVDKFRITAFYIPTQKEYPTDNFTAELVYAETLRERDYAFYIKVPVRYGELLGLDTYPLSVPDVAPIGSYDLRVTDLDTGFTWSFENMAWVLPAGETPYGLYEDEDWICEVSATKPTLMQGEDHTGVIHMTIKRKHEDASSILMGGAELICAEDESYSITIAAPMVSSIFPPPYIPVDAPVGRYHLVVGNRWRFENFIEITANPDREQERFGFRYVMDEPIVSRSAGKTYTFVAMMENRGDPFTVTVTNENRHAPETVLIYADAPEGTGEIFELPLRHATGPAIQPYEWTWRTGQVSSNAFEIMVTPDTPCGLYDLTLSYEDCTVTFKGVVEVVP